MPHPQYKRCTDHEAKDSIRNCSKEERVVTTGVMENKLESKPSMDINESAELFIQKFRQQLLIQRLESIENYEQMLARGT